MSQLDLQMPNLGTRIKSELSLRGLYQKDLAQILGVSQATLSNKISGSIRFTADEIAEISRLLNVSADSLLGLKPLEVK